MNSTDPTGDASKGPEEPAADWQDQHTDAWGNENGMPDVDPEAAADRRKTKNVPPEEPPPYSD